MECKKILKKQENEGANINIEAPKATKTIGVLLTEKYKPVGPRDLIGNKSNISSLVDWLRDWEDVQIKGNKKKVKVVRGNWGNAPKLNAKAVLISGPPGIGKTSTARIISKDLGFETLEMNASDTRNKKSIENMIRNLSTNNSLDYYTKGHTERKNQFNKNKKSVIIMDEVDGCGGGDRGGISALIQVIKLTKTPIICICNDRDNRKLASLINHCMEVKFSRPTPKQIIGRIQQIATAEGLSIDDKGIELLINQSGNDIRQVITQIQVMLTTTKSLSYGDVKRRVDNISKDGKLMINNFQAANKLLNHSDYRDMTFREKMDMFFIDYDFVPLLVQENYLGAMDRTFTGSLSEVAKMANAAQFISLGDTVNK